MPRAWHEPAFLSKPLFPQKLWQVAHCSGPTPSCLTQSPFHHQFPLVSLAFLISPFLLAISPHLKITFFKALFFTKKIFGRGAAPTLAPSPQSHSLTLCPLVCTTTASWKDFLQGFLLAPSLTFSGELTAVKWLHLHQLHWNYWVEISCGGSPVIVLEISSGYSYACIYLTLLFYRYK